MKSTIVGFATALLVSGGSGLAGLEVAAGTAQAYTCNGIGVCSMQWCPGQTLPARDVVWDMSVCHDYYSGTVGERGTDGGIQVGAHIIEGDPSPANTCDGMPPICLPGL
jgi:hypothetical protein